MLVAHVHLARDIDAIEEPAVHPQDFLDRSVSRSPIMAPKLLLQGLDRPEQEPSDLAIRPLEFLTLEFLDEGQQFGLGDGVANRLRFAVHATGDLFRVHAEHEEPCEPLSLNVRAQVHRTGATLIPWSWFHGGVVLLSQKV